MMRRARQACLLISALSVSLVSCSGVVGVEQPWVGDGGGLPLRAGESVGQTFVANQAGLSGVEVFLSPDAPGQGEVWLHLRASSVESGDLAQARLPLADVAGPAFYRFTFTPQPASAQRGYYLTLELVGDGCLRVGSAPGEAYLDGAAYQNGQPLDAQLAFRFIYDPLSMGLGMIGQMVRWLGMIGLAIFLYVLPGWACLSLLWSGVGPISLSGAEKAGLSVGLSLALYPLLLLWTKFIGLRLGPLYAWGPGLMGLGVLLWLNRAAWRSIRWRGLTAWRITAAPWPEVALLVLTALIFFTRLFAIRLLIAPSWGDSVQHAVMTQLILDHGGLFDSWLPYTPYRTLTVQFGFSVASALWAWLSGLSSTQATLVTGQILNGLAVVTIYPLAVRLAQGNRWAGVGAVLISGLLSPMPAYYVNWGRYAQLAGQAILPAALWLLLDAVQSRMAAWTRTVLAGVVLAGMMLTYYRMPFYYAVFALAWFMIGGALQWRLNLRCWWDGGVRLVLIAGVALLLVVPWVVHVSGGHLAQAVEAGVTAGAPLESVLSDYQIWREITFYAPLVIMVMALAGLVLGLIQGRWETAAIGLWVIGLASLVAGRLIRLPGANLMQNFAVLIALYIPASLLGGWAIGQAAHLAGRLVGKMAGPLASGALIMAAGWGAWTQLGIVQPQFIMVTAPDMRAMQWIRESTPAEARFLVEGFRIYGGRSIVGADAGWWIPLLAGRENMMPPQYALLNEQPGTVNYSQQVVDLIARLENVSPGSSEGARWLCSQGVTHVYIGQGQGKVGAGVSQLFSPDELVNSPAFKMIYRQDRVYIFALDPQVCGASR